MESVDLSLESQAGISTKIDKKPGILHHLRENVFNRFADPRECETLEDVIGKKVEYRTLSARRLDWAPRKLDIARMAETIKLVKEQQNFDQPLKIVDVAGHSGFLDRLILDELDKKTGTRSNVEITVVDPDKIITNKAKNYYKERETRIGFKTEKIQDFTKLGEQADVVICSWMRPEMDLRPEIEKLNPKIIIFVKDVAGDVGQEVSFTESDKYEQASAWLGFSGHDIDYYQQFLGKAEATNITLIMRKKDDNITQQAIKDALVNTKVDKQDEYAWEPQLPQLNVGSIHDKDDYTTFHTVQD